jgi:hypothetical protein
MTVTWHADDDQLSRYVRGDADPVDGASIEQHLVHCSSCRERIAAHVPTQPLQMTWDRIRHAAEEPPPTLVQRALVRLGVSPSDALIVAAAPSLRTSWLLGLAATLGFVGLSVAYGAAQGLAFFLIIAPLVPVVGVAAAYGPAVDPAYELAAAAPYRGERLLLLRTAAVLATCLPLVAATSLLVPALNAFTFAWLLPALAFAVVLLAASTFCRPVLAATGLGLAWACAVGAAGLARRADAVLMPAVLLGYVALGIAAAVVLCLRLHHLTEPGSPT